MAEGEEFLFITQSSLCRRLLYRLGVTKQPYELKVGFGKGLSVRSLKEVAAAVCECSLRSKHREGAVLWLPSSISTSGKGTMGIVVPLPQRNSCIPQNLLQNR